MKRNLLSCTAIVLVGALVLPGCDKNPMGSLDYGNNAPFVYGTTLTPDSVNMTTLPPVSDGYLVNVSIRAIVNHPERYSAVQLVMARVFDPSTGNLIGQGVLRADPGTPDSTTTHLGGAVSFTVPATGAGRYPVEVQATGRNGLASNIQHLTLIVAGPNVAPSITVVGFRAVAPLPSGTPRFLLTAAVTDPNGITDIRQVTVRFVNSTDTSTHVLYDDGSATHGDQVAGDGVYSDILPVPPSGNLNDVIFQFNASDLSGAQSPQVTRSMRNHPPHIIAIAVPDTIQRPSGTGTLPIPFHVTVADSDGLQDISSVWFRNFSATTPQDFFMFDDGNLPVHGDAVANDGIYSLIVSITATSSTGRKEFHFYVLDHAGAQEEVIRYITVI